MFEGFEKTKIDAHGCRIHLVHGGSGPALLLLHGYPQTHVEWHKVAPALAEEAEFEDDVDEPVISDLISDEETVYGDGDGGGGVLHDRFRQNT